MPYDDEPDFVFIGNVDMMEPLGLGNNEPFFIGLQSMPEVGPVVMIATNILDPMVHSVEIYATTEDVTKLSGKYVEGMGYTDVTTKSVYRQNTIVSSEGGINDYSRYFEEPLGGLYTSDFDLAARYNVVFNGTLYENLEVRSWVTHGGAGRTEYYIGSVNTPTGMIGDTNCPFTINLQGYTGENLVVGLAWESSYGPEVTLAIDRIEEVVHPVDKKYLPSGCGCLVLTADWASDGANGETTANMTFAEAYAMLMNGAPTVYRQNYGYDMSIYSNTDVTCYEDQIVVKVYAENEWLVTVTFKSDGTIGIPMEG